MAAREDIARALAPLLRHAMFGDYVKTLEAKRDALVRQLLYIEDENKVPALRGHARAYDELITQIATAIKDIQT